MILSLLWLLQIIQASRLCFGKRIQSGQVAAILNYEHKTTERSIDDEILEIIKKALMGQWRTGDYYFHSNSSNLVNVELPTEMKAARQLKFRAASPQFTGDKGSAGSRDLIVSPLPYEPPRDGKQQPIARIEQKFDEMHLVHDVGYLIPEGSGWIIAWDSKRQWRRELSDASIASESSLNSTHDAAGKEAEKKANALLEDWNRYCSANELSPVIFSIIVAAGASAGWSLVEGKLGASGYIEVVGKTTPDSVKTHSEHLQCILGRMKVWALEAAASGKEGKSTFEGSFDAFHLVSTQFQKWSAPSLPEWCFPSASIGLSFSILAHPPFIWPIPKISIGFSWPLPWEEIKVCGRHSDAGDMLTAAFASRPDEVKDDRDMNDVNEQVQALKMQSIYTQGPTIGIFPFPSSSPASYGWCWHASFRLTVNIRKSVRAWRTAKSALFRQLQPRPCEMDRVDYFKSVIDWARSVHDIKTTPSCVEVQAHLDAIQREHPEADIDIEKDPFSVVPYLEQLGDPRYRQNDSFSIPLGGVKVDVSNSGVNTGFAFQVMRSDSAAGGVYHNRACPPFANFVNIYQQRVVHARNDVLRMDRKEECSLEPLPPLLYDDCDEANVGSGQKWRDLFWSAPADPELRTYPYVYVDRADPDKIVRMTSSHCTQCLMTRAYGDPCVFCSESEYIARCSARFEASWTCLAQAAKVPLNSFDDRSVEPLLQCVRKDDLRFVDADPYDVNRPTEMPTRICKQCIIDEMKKRFGNWSDLVS